MNRPDLLAFDLNTPVQQIYIEARKRNMRPEYDHSAGVIILRPMPMLATITTGIDSAVSRARLRIVR